MFLSIRKKNPVGRRKVGRIWENRDISHVLGCRHEKKKRMFGVGKNRDGSDYLESGQRRRQQVRAQINRGGKGKKKGHNVFLVRGGGPF